MKKKHSSILRLDGVQTLLASLLCILGGLLVGFIVLLLIEPSGAWEAITSVLQSFFRYPSAKLQLKYFGQTLTRTAPLIMCSLSVLFAYKVGMFNIGVAGQYVAGAGACLYAALAWQCPWYVCLLLAIAAGAVFGAFSGVLKAYCNVNEVISGIMLNWIMLYTTNMVLTNVKEPTSPYTFQLKNAGRQAILPTLGLDKIFHGNAYVTVAVPAAVLMALLIWVVLDKTKFGYELKATGNNRFAAKYCGMAEKRNIILTLVIAGALSGFGAALLYLTGFEQWQCTASSVPGMGFNGIAAAFLGGLNPIGTIFASYFIQHITSGGAYVDKSLYCSQISDLISAVIIYLCGFVLFIKFTMNRMIAKREEKAAKALAEQEENAPAEQEESRKGGGM